MPTDINKIWGNITNTVSGVIDNLATEVGIGGVVLTSEEQISEAATTVQNITDMYNEAVDNGSIDKYGAYVNNKGSLTEASTKILTSLNINGIFGMPYQFLSSVDRRLDSDDDTVMGRKYAEKVASHLPLLFLTACRPVFMEQFNSKERESVISKLLQNSSLEKGDIEKSGRYYSSEFAYAEYYNIVNIMCSEVAYLCGINEETVNIAGQGEVELGKIDWSKVRNDSFNNYFAAKRSVVLYIDDMTTIQDSISTSTTDSQLASTVNGFADQMKELRFIFGNESAAAKIGEYAGKATTFLTGALDSLGVTGALTGGLISDLSTTGIQTVLEGGKILFPKIWGDSTFSRSYNFTLKLRSPDHDSISIFLNILVPYIHLLAMCLPQSITKGDAAYSPNAYNSPFIVRAYAKGLFNIDLGMITDLSVTRGAESQWNDNGLPTQIDINITIEDLYSTLFITNPNQDGSPIGADSLTSFFNLDIVSNTDMLDFLSNLAGLNVASTGFGRRVELARYLMGGITSRAVSNIYNWFDQSVSNMIRRLFNV